MSVEAEDLDLEEEGYDKKEIDKKKEYQRWQDEFAIAKKFVEKWHKEAKKVNNRFLGLDDMDDMYGDLYRKLNLFHSNIVTLQSMLYGSTPKVEIDRTFSDAKDDVARVASMMGTRIIQQDIQSAGEELKTTVRAALQDRLLGGMGSARIKYEVEEEEVEYPPIYVQDDDGNETDELLAEGYTDNEIKTERVFEVYTHWRDLLWSPARTYDELRWKAYRSYLTKKKFHKRFPEIELKKITFTAKSPTETGSGTEEKGEAIKQVEVWEIWSKDDKCVYWYTEGYQEILDHEEDPLELDGFWPDPPPMIANLTTSKYLPRSDYALAQDLYVEIDELQTRITNLTKAAKLVGAYDKTADGLKRIFTEGVENDLIPVDNWAMFAEKGGIKGVIDWIPLEAVVAAIQILTEKQGEKIQQLYQITGMSDILRGSSQPYEAAATSTAKVQFASIKIQALQDEFARFVSDLQSLKLEVIQKHFQDYCIVEQSNIMYTESAQYAQQAVAFLKDRKKARWRIKIRPETLAMADFAQLKADRMDYIMGVAQFMQSAAPLVQLDKKIVPILLQLLQWGLAGFKGASDIETVMDQAIDMYKKVAQEPPPPDPEEKKQQAEMQMKQMELQGKMQQDQQKAQMEMMQMQQKFQLEMQKMQMEMRQDQQKFQLELQKLFMELGFKKQQLQMETESEEKKQAAQFAFNTAERASEHEANEADRQGQMEANEHAHSLQMESQDAKARANKSNGGQE